MNVPLPALIMLMIVVMIIVVIFVVDSVKRRKTLIKEHTDDEKLKPIVAEQTVRARDVSKSFPPADPRFYGEAFKRKFKKKEMFLILMQMRNDTYSMFTVATRVPFFVKDGFMYQINPDMARYDATSKMNMLYYHQDVAIPIKISINLKELTDTIKKDDKSIVKALNPSSLKEFIHSQVIEKVLKGQELSKEMQMIKIILIIVGIVCIINLIILVKYTGII